MANKVKFTLQNAPVGLSSINAVVTNKEQDTLLWSGVHATTGGAVELDIGTAGTDGQNVWVYGNNAGAGTESTANAFGGYSVIEGSAPALPSFDYDAVAFVGDSITNQSAESREDKLALAFEQAGFNPVIEVYGSGISGHTTKTFTEKFLGQVAPTTSSRTLSDYETLLAGKKVLFIDVLRTNDWKEVCVNSVDYAVQKAECETWTATLANAIKNSSLDADYAIASQPYNDWRNINVRGSQGFDIIDGSAAQYDQTVAWQSEVVDALCQQHSPDWFANGRCFFDFFTETRNYFRYWFGSDNDSIHPDVNTSELYRTYFANRCFAASESNVSDISVDELYSYPEEISLAIGEECLFDFSRVYDTHVAEQQGYLKNSNINIISLADLRETTVKKSDGSLVGNRSYMVTSGINTRTTSGSGNAGNETVSLQNHYLLKSASYVNTGETMNINISGLTAGTVFDMSIVAAYNDAASTSKVTANGTVISLTTTQVSGGVAPTATGSVTVDGNGEINATLESLDGLGFGMLSGLSLTRTA